MERDGLVRTEAAKEDARSIRIRPTARGKALLLAGKKRRVDSLAKAVAELPPAEIEQLDSAVEVLRKVIRRIEI